MDWTHYREPKTRQDSCATRETTAGPFGEKSRLDVERPATGQRSVANGQSAKRHALTRALPLQPVQP